MVSAACQSALTRLNVADLRLGEIVPIAGDGEVGEEGFRNVEVLLIWSLEVKQPLIDSLGQSDNFDTTNGLVPGEGDCAIAV